MRVMPHRARDREGGAYPSSDSTAGACSTTLIESRAPIGMASPIERTRPSGPFAGRSILCSTAARTRGTLELARLASAASTVLIEDDLCAATTEQLLAGFREVPETVDRSADRPQSGSPAARVLGVRRGWAGGFAGEVPDCGARNARDRGHLGSARARQRDTHGIRRPETPAPERRLVHWSAAAWTPSGRGSGKLDRTTRREGVEIP
jgi:hypothetical protein